MIKIQFESFFSSEQFTAMSDELERRREECLQLRAMLAEKSITTHAIAKESYGGMDDIVNEDNELALAYRTQKELKSQRGERESERERVTERVVAFKIQIFIIYFKKSKNKNPVISFP